MIYKLSALLVTQYKLLRIYLLSSKGHLSRLKETFDNRHTIVSSHLSRNDSDLRSRSLWDSSLMSRPAVQSMLSAKRQFLGPSPRMQPTCRVSLEMLNIFPGALMILVMAGIPLTFKFARTMPSQHERGRELLLTRHAILLLPGDERLASHTTNSSLPFFVP